MKVWSLKNLEERRHEYLPFDGEWEQAFGHPEKSGCWIVYGHSGQGKTSFVLQLARKLGPGKTVVTVLPDTAERYFSTPLFQDN